jgi:hypothetical protein
MLCFFLTLKDRLNELYIVTGIKLSSINFEILFWMFIKAVIRALLNGSSRLTRPAQLHMNSPLDIEILNKAQPQPTPTRFVPINDHVLLSLKHEHDSFYNSILIKTTYLKYNVLNVPSYKY